MLFQLHTDGPRLRNEFCDYQKGVVFYTLVLRANYNISIMS
jgi:hypothetical protein